MSSSLVPLKTRRVGARCTLNLSRTQTSSRWYGVVIREERGLPSQAPSSSLDYGSKLRGPSPKSPRVAEQCNVLIFTPSWYFIITLLSKAEPLDVYGNNDRDEGTR
ncbi:hypothetical protein TNCV_1985821 [Trichonephila clavipes]|nr:hypothetical protein TNCV_1985821 [Trichonephila clavipes]